MPDRMEKLPAMEAAVVRLQAQKAAIDQREAEREKAIAKAKKRLDDAISLIQSKQVRLQGGDGQ